MQRKNHALHTTTNLNISSFRTTKIITTITLCIIDKNCQRYEYKMISCYDVVNWYNASINKTLYFLRNTIKTILYNSNLVVKLINVRHQNNKLPSKYFASTRLVSCPDWHTYGGLWGKKNLPAKHQTSTYIDGNFVICEDNLYNLIIF